MSRRRWVQLPNGDLLEVSRDYVSPERPVGNTDAILYNDRLYQDGGDARFSSRSQHREYMRQHGLTTMDDFKSQWREAERKKVEFRQTGKDPTRRADVERAIHKLSNGA